jgi:hypothetical protein
MFRAGSGQWAIALSVMSVFLVLHIGRVSAEPQMERSECKWGACLFIKYDTDLADEANALVETLRLRLCKRNVQVIVEPSVPQDLTSDDESVEQTSNECPQLKENRSRSRNLWWVAHLRASSPEYVLVAVDHLGSRSNDDLIREVPKGPEPTATAWTIALIIEEAVAPYLDADQEQAPLGAGLAIIEPPAVGGTRKAVIRRRTQYPEMRCVSIGLASVYLGTGSDSVNDFLLGPTVGIQALLGPKFATSLNAGWVGTGNFDYESDDGVGIKGVVSYVPFELLFGYVPLSHHIVDLTIFGGISTGFSVFKITSSSKQETYFYFDPWILVRAEVTLHIYGPLAMYVNGGVDLPIRRDVFTNYGEEVFRQDLVIPSFGLGLQLWI